MIKKTSLILAALLVVSMFPLQALAVYDPFAPNNDRGPRKHTHNYMRAESKWEVPYDAEYHEVKTDVMYICRLCGERSYQDEAIERQRIKREGIKLEKHVFDRNGKCTTCGYVRQNGTNQGVHQTTPGKRDQHDHEYEMIEDLWVSKWIDKDGQAGAILHEIHRNVQYICKICGRPGLAETAKEETGTKYNYHHFDSNGRCTECGYVKSERTKERERNAERFYHELSRYDRAHSGQSGRPGYNPLDDDTIRNMVREELIASGFGDHAEAIIDALWHTDAAEYRELCLWTFFDYDRTVITKGTSNFSPMKNTMSDYSGNSFNICTFFHETGHATDFSSAMNGANYNTDHSEVLRGQLENTIHDIVGGYLTEVDNDLSLADMEIVIAAIMNQKSSDKTPPKYMNDRQKQAFTRTLNKLNADYGAGMSGNWPAGDLVLEARGDSVMLADMMCGFTNNKVSPYTIAHYGNNYGEDHSETYWDERQPNGQTEEAYAEYFSSQITGVSRDENRLFSEACETMDQITHEALEQVKEKRCKDPVWTFVLNR